MRWRDLPKVSQGQGRGGPDYIQKAVCRGLSWGKEGLRIQFLPSGLPSLAPALLLTGCCSASSQM